MRMRVTISALFGLLVVAACSKDNPGPAPSEITGTWQATKDEYIAKAAPHVSVDLVGAGGSATLVLNEDHTLILTEKPLTGSESVLNATWELETDLMRVTPVGATWYWAWDVSLSGNTLHLTGADRLYDCDGDATPEEADWNLTLTR